jgi:DUF4097 and DUF4098 domain-containing protein YvlB
MSDNEYTQSVSTAEFTETPRLILEQATGDVRIEAWDKPEVSVTVTDGEQAFEMVVVGSQITVRGRVPNVHLSDYLAPAVSELSNLGLGLEKVAARVERSVQRSVRRMGRGTGLSINVGNWGWGSGRDYLIKVPIECHVTLRTSTGDLVIKGVHGTHFLQATSGDIRLEEAQGNLIASSASGDIFARNFQGKLGVRSASGDIEVAQGNLQELSAHTASGDVDIDLLNTPERDFELKSVSGDILLSLPQDARLTAEISTLSGDVHCRLPHERTRREERRGANLIINGGGPRARINTVSGDIRIEGRGAQEYGGAPTTDLSRTSSEGSQARADATSARRQKEMEILQALERGELSPQDAMARLSELR